MSADFGTFADFYLNGAYAHCPQEHRKGGSYAVGMLEAAQFAGSYVDPPLPQTSFVEVLEAPATCWLDFGVGRRTYRARDLDGRIGPQPASVESHLTMNSDHRIRALHLDCSILAEILDRAGFRGDPLEGLYAEFTDTPRARMAFRTLWDQLRIDDPATSLAVDGAFLSFLSLYLPDRSTDLTPDWVPFQEDARLRRVIKYIDANLAEQLLMDELARVANLSAPHFARIFRKTFGMTAHAYVTGQRIERAKRALRTTRMPVTVIAMACGFGSSAHFSTVFRRYVGVPPSRYRSNLE